MPEITSKDTNPKDAVGIKKVPLRSVVPAQVVAQLALALLEGARKYGRGNYRVAKVRASVYYDANGRHMDDWWEGEDIDPESLICHVFKAMASLAVLGDAILNGNLIDDRPVKSKKGWLQQANAEAKRIVETVRPDDPEEPYTELKHGAGRTENGEHHGV